MKKLSFDSQSEQQTARLGAALADVAPDGVVMALVGDLGAGKTRLVQAIARACGAPAEAVVSPTFVLVHEYPGRRPVFHFDAYRLADEDEFLALGPDEYFDSDGLSLIEWADRVAGCLPRELLRVEITITGEHSRRIDVVAEGESLAAVVEALRAQLNDPPKR